ncbi:MAG: DUF742 domain-containing protein [Actinomycetota bacterium]
MPNDGDNRAGQPLGGETSDFVRPFLVTTGRTKASIEGLRFETLVQATAKAASDLRFEAAKIHRLCSDAIAIAEVSAKLTMPIGTAKVVVGDLIDSGHLVLHQTIDAEQTEDIQLISRLIDGVRRL